MNWAYVAGYFDGEGHVSKNTYRINWCNSHLPSLEAMQDFIGAGAIRARKGTNVPVYILDLQGLTSIRRVVPHMLKHCLVKRDALLDLCSRMEGKVAVPNYGMSLDPDLLHKLYWDERLSANEIGRQLGICAVTVDDHLRKHGIPVRSQAEASANMRLLGKARGRFSYGDFPMKHADPDEVRRLYWDENLPTDKLAAKFGISRAGIRDYMRRHGIPTRTRAEAGVLRRT